MTERNAAYYGRVTGKGVPNGLATLGPDGKVPDEQLPEGMSSAVASVNGHTGAVILDASDVGADPAGTAAAAVADLTLGEAATLDVGTGAGTVAAGDDPRLSDSRTPTSHAASLASAGTDPVTPAAIGAARSGHTHTGTYDPAGTAASAVTTHAGASDPHGDRAYTTAQVATRLALTGGTVTGLLTLARLAMTAPDDQTTLVTLTAYGTTDSVTSADLAQIVQNGSPTTWLNENGSIRGQTAKTSEAAVRWYGRSGQVASIWQILRSRSDTTVLAAVNPDGSMTLLGALTASNYANSAWTDLTATNGNYTAETSGGTAYVPGCRAEGAAGELIRLRGRFTVTNTASGDIVTTLPSGFRPARAVGIQFANGASTGITGTIATNGQITCGRAVTGANWLSLDAIVFCRTV